MLRFFCWITGDDFALVKVDTPKSRKKIQSLATCILIPVILWFFNGFFLVRNTLGGSLMGAVLAAVVVSFLILLIERMIVMTDKTRLISVFRIILGLSVAAIGALSMDEVIFKNDIAVTLRDIRDDLVKQKLQFVDSVFEKPVDSAARVTMERYASYKAAHNKADLEMMTGTGGKHRMGPGRNYRQLLYEANGIWGEYLDARERLDSLRKSLVAAENLKKKDVEYSFKGGSVLWNIKAIVRLVSEDMWVLAVYIVFTVMLLGFEFLVIVVKSGWSDSNYDRKVELLEEIGRDRMVRIRGKDKELFEPEAFHSRTRYARDVLSAPLSRVLS